jgi:hypothetical protein
VTIIAGCAEAFSVVACGGVCGRRPRRQEQPGVGASFEGKHAGARCGVRPDCIELPLTLPRFQHLKKLGVPVEEVAPIVATTSSTSGGGGGGGGGGGASLNKRRVSHLTRSRYVTRHSSHVTPHTSLVTRHTSHVTRHSSHVTRHTSHVTRHTSRVVCLSPPGRILSPILPPPPSTSKAAGTMLYEERCVKPFLCLRHFPPPLTPCFPPLFRNCNLQR